MNNNEFTYIKEVAKQKSFSKASKALGISQPALSNYIKKLEDRMGVLLFDRSISPIEITEFWQGIFGIRRGCYISHRQT